MPMQPKASAMVSAVTPSHRTASLPSMGSLPKDSERSFSSRKDLSMETSLSSAPGSTATATGTMDR